MPDFSLESAKSGSHHLNYAGRIMGDCTEKLLVNVGVNVIPATLCSVSLAGFGAGVPYAAFRCAGSKCVNQTVTLASKAHCFETYSLGLQSNRNRSIHPKQMLRTEESFTRVLI